MAVPSLGFLCRQVVKDNIDELAYVGNLPYEAVKDLLILVKTADQLATIEENSPQIINMTDHLYEKFVKTVHKVPHKRKELAYRHKHGVDPKAMLSPTWWKDDMQVDTWKDLFHKYTVEQGEYSSGIACPNRSISLHSLTPRTAVMEEESLKGLKANKAKLEQQKKSQQATVVQPQDLPKIRAATKTAGSRRPVGKLSTIQKISSQTRQLAHQRNMVMKSTNNGSQQQQQRKIAPPKKVVTTPKPAAIVTPNTSPANDLSPTTKSGSASPKPLTFVKPTSGLFHSNIKLPEPKIIIRRYPAEKSSPAREPTRRAEVTPPSPTDSLFGPSTPLHTTTATPSKKRPADDDADATNPAAANISGASDPPARPMQKRRRQEPSLFISKTDVRKFVKD